MATPPSTSTGTTIGVAPTTIDTSTTDVVGTSSSSIINISSISTLQKQSQHNHRILLLVRCNAPCVAPLSQVLSYRNNNNNSNNTSYTNSDGLESNTKVASSDGGVYDGTTLTTTISEEEERSAAQATNNDDPFGFLNNNSNNNNSSPSSNTSTQNNNNNNNKSRQKPNLGRFLKTVAAKSSKAIERGVHSLAVRADQGRSPDQYIMGLYDAHTNALLSATEAVPAPNNRSHGLWFRVPLCLDGSHHDNDNTNNNNSTIQFKLWIRSGAALANTKGYLIVASSVINATELRTRLQTQQPCEHLTLDLSSAVVVQGGALTVTAIPDNKFPPTCGPGWSLQDPDPSQGNLYNNTLDQSYSLPIPGLPHTTTLLATERTVESTVILPIATAVAELSYNATRHSVQHLEGVSREIFATHIDSESSTSSSQYAKVTFKVSHLQTNVSSAALLHNNKIGATIAAGYQRPNSIFETQVLAASRLPLHPSAAGGLSSRGGGGEKPLSAVTFYPPPVTANVLPAVLQQCPNATLPPCGYALGTLRLQVKVPKRRADAVVVADPPLDTTAATTTGSSSSAFETWECLVPLDGLPQQQPPPPGSSPTNNNNTSRQCIIYNAAGQNMGTLFLTLTATMMAGSNSEPPPPTASLAGGGLVALMGLPPVTDGVSPILDFDPSMIQNAVAQTEEGRRRRSQLATMGHFVTHSYLEQHLELVRRVDLRLMEERARTYRIAIQTAMSPSSSKTSAKREPPYKDRSPKPFRPSSSRNTVLLSGIGFNVHTASLTLNVLEPPSKKAAKQQVAVFHNITCGAPADHARGFSNIFGPEKTSSVPSPIGPVAGGLRRLEGKRKKLAEEISNQQTTLIMSLANYFVEQRKFQTSPVTHVPADHAELQGLRWKVFEAVHCLHHLTWTCAVRRASVFSQALGIALSSYLTHVSDPTKLHSTWPELWRRHGFLVSYEGLLSAAGKELGMIEDASVGIEMLRNVRIMLAPDDGSVNAARVPVPHSKYLRWVHLWTASNPNKSPAAPEEFMYVLQIGIEKGYFDQRIPNALKNGSVVTLYPLLFEVGVDIFQAASNAGSNMSKGMNQANCNTDTTGQDPMKEVLSDDEDDAVGISDDDVLTTLNYEAFQRMNVYAQLVAPAAPVQATPTHQTHPMLATLFQHIVSSSGKMNHDILDEAAALAHQLGGGGAVFCKSGKDRTAMHVTYKQAQFATKFRRQEQQQSGEASVTTEAEDTTLDDAMLIRLYGTRLPICEKNVGQAKYAFNSLQVRFMPDALKPPASALAGFLKGGKVFGGGGIES